MEIGRLVQLYHELIFSEVYYLKSIDIKKNLDTFKNNIIHYLVFYENIEKMKKFIHVLVTMNYDSYKTLVEQTNEFNESPKDWALAIGDEELREEIYSLLSIQRERRLKKNPYYTTPHDSQIHGYSLNFVVPSLRSKQEYGDDFVYIFTTKREQSRLHFYPIYGKNLIKETLRKNLIPHSILSFFSKNQGGLILKGQFIEPRFRRAYLHFYRFFENSSFTLEHARERLSEVREDVSNMNLIIKRLIDNNLAVKVQKEIENINEKIKNPAGRPKALYRLRDFFITSEECAGLIEDKATEDLEYIGRLLNPIRAMFRWFEGEVTDREQLLMMFSVIRSYYKVFKGRQIFSEFDFYYGYDKKQRKRGRKKETVELPLWIKCAGNFSEKVFERIKNREIELSKLDILSLFIELFHHRAKVFGNALSYELKGFIAGLISDRISEIYGNQKYIIETNSINLIVPFIDPNLTFLFVLISLIKDGKRVNLYLLDPISSELRTLLKFLFEDTDVTLNSLSELHLKGYPANLDPYKTFLIVNFSSELVDGLDKGKPLFISNLLRDIGANAIFILPDIKENELIELSKEKSLKKEILINKIHHILKRYNLNLSNIDHRISLIKLRDRASSGSQGTYGILFFHDRDVSAKHVYFTEEIENYLFTLSWIRESLRIGKLNFVFEYPRDYFRSDSKVIESGSKVIESGSKVIELD